MIITEERLRNIIREGIKKQLTELHWKTWDSAAEKSNGARKRAFAAKRDSEFNSQFGHNVDKTCDFENGDGFVKMQDGRYRGGEVDNSNGRKHQTFGRNINSTGRYDNYEQNNMSTSRTVEQPKFHSKKIARKFANGANEIDRMRNATYTKSQGWQSDPKHKDADWHEFHTDEDW